MTFLFFFETANFIPNVSGFFYGYRAKTSNIAGVKVKKMFLFMTLEKVGKS